MSKAKAAFNAAARGALSKRTVTGYKIQAPELDPTFCFTVGEAVGVAVAARRRGYAAYITNGASDMVLPRGVTINDPLAALGEKLPDLFESARQCTPREFDPAWINPWKAVARESYKELLAAKERERAEKAAAEKAAAEKAAAEKAAAEKVAAQRSKLAALGMTDLEIDAFFSV